MSALKTGFNANSRIRFEYNFNSFYPSAKQAERALDMEEESEKGLNAGADPGMKKRGGTLLLAGDSVHSAPSMGSGGMPPQENFEILTL